MAVYVCDDMILDYRDIDNVPGIRRVVIADDGGRQAYSGRRSSYDVSAIDLYGRMVYEVFFAPGSAELVLSASPSGNGWVHDKRLRVDVPKLSKEVTAWHGLNAERRWLVWIEDANGQVCRIGMDGRGAAMLIEGSNKEGYSGWTVQWVLSGKDAVFYEDVNINDIAMTADTIDLREYAVRNIVLRQGQTMSVDFEFGNPPENLASNVFSCTVKNAAGATVVSFGMGTGFAIVGGTVLRMSKTATESATWAKGVHSYEIWRTLADGVTKKAVFVGSFTVE